MGGAVAVAGALGLNGAEHGRFTQCFAGQSMSIVVLPAGFPGKDKAPELPPGTPAQVETVPGVSHVEEVYGGPLETGSRPLAGIILPEGGLPMLPLVSGTLPASARDAVLDRSTASALGLRPGDRFPVSGATGRTTDLRLSGIIGIDMDTRQIVRGAVGLGPQTARSLMGRPELNGMQLTVAGTATPSTVRDLVAAKLGPGPEVFTRKEFAARRDLDAQILTVSLAVLGLTVLLFAAAISSITYGRLRESWLRPPNKAIAKHGLGPIRKLMTFDRVIGLPIALISGVAIGTGTLVVLSALGADMSCTGVYSVLGLTVLIPTSAFFLAMFLAPIPSLLHKWRGKI
ncbi:MAG: hypothetical protein HOV86_00445 [Thermoactinospora sp.]|nr:hypothetical protein [Thermoactinospora sp.]